jgi:hypothetical protein
MTGKAKREIEKALKRLNKYHAAAEEATTRLANERKVFTAIVEANGQSVNSVADLFGADVIGAALVNSAEFRAALGL